MLNDFIHTSYQQTLQIIGYKTRLQANLADYQPTLQYLYQEDSKTMSLLSSVTVLLIFSMAAFTTAHDAIEITEKSEYRQGCVGEREHATLIDD